MPSSPWSAEPFAAHARRALARGPGRDAGGPSDRSILRLRSSRRAAAGIAARPRLLLDPRPRAARPSGRARHTVGGAARADPGRRSAIRAASRAAGWCLGEPRAADRLPPSSWSWSVWAVEPGFRAAAVVRLEGGRAVAEAEAGETPRAGHGAGRRSRVAAAEADDHDPPPAGARADLPPHGEEPTRVAARVRAGARAGGGGAGRWRALPRSQPPRFAACCAPRARAPG